MKVWKNRVLAAALSCALVLSLAACGGKGDGNGGAKEDAPITVVSRDAASGTRSAFHELLGITVKEGDKEVDQLVTGSLEFDGTDKVITAVEGDPNAIGYISMGSLSDRIKPLAIDGVPPTAENVKNGSYRVSRPFLLVTGKEGGNEMAKDFLSFVLSGEGQKIVTDGGYIPSEEAPKDYTPKWLSGKLRISGSTSVEPLLQKLAARYQELNPEMSLEIQAQGSSQGIKDAISGTADIGMSSRALKAEEAQALSQTTLALDGIAVIVHKDNPRSGLTQEQVTQIYKGAITKWGEIS